MTLLFVTCRLLVTNGIRFCVSKLKKPTVSFQPTVSPHQGSYCYKKVLYSAGWVLFFLFRTLRRLSGIRYGLSALPSFLSRSSTGKRFNKMALNWLSPPQMFSFLYIFARAETFCSLNRQVLFARGILKLNQLFRQFHKNTIQLVFNKCVQL